jgi:hypothetical protein
MQRARNQLDLNFPKKYLQKFKQNYGGYYKQAAKKRRIKKPSSELAEITNRCKQAMPLANLVYCCALREEIDAELCQCCPNYDPEPLEYALFRRG